MKKNILAGIILIFICIFSTSLSAHYLWLFVDNYNVSPGDEININVGWGHKFPKDSQPRKEMIKNMKLFIIGPNNKIISIKVQPSGERGVKPIKIRLKNEGTYVAVLEMKSFVTKTIEGYFYKPKNELQNVLESFFYESIAKTIFNVGKPKGNILKKQINDGLELIPLKNPFFVKKGTILPILCLLNGKINPKSWLYATYAGFSSLKDTFAFTTKTDKHGVGKIKILKKGLWLIKTEKELPYNDTSKADYFKFVSTLTFNIK